MVEVITKEQLLKIMTDLSQTSTSGDLPVRHTMIRLNFCGTYFGPPGEGTEQEIIDVEKGVEIIFERLKQEVIKAL